MLNKIIPINANLVPKTLDKSFSRPLMSKLDNLFSTIHELRTISYKKRIYHDKCYGYYFDVPLLSLSRKKDLVSMLNATLKTADMPVYAGIGSSISIDIILKGVHKGTALEHFCQITGISRDDVLKFGDNPEGNDKELLRGVNSFVITEGPEEVLKILKKIL